LLLLSASIYSWYVIYNKSVEFLYFYKLGEEFQDFVKKNPSISRLNSEKSIYFEFYDALLNVYRDPFTEGKREEVSEQILEKIKLKWEIAMEKDLDYLSIIGSIAPFVGLFGTVWGIMNSFKSIAMANSTSIAIVAPALSEALFVTAFGIFVAIPANFASHIFYSKIESCFKNLSAFKEYLIERLEK